MKPHMNKLLLTSFSIGSAAVLIGPAISVLTQQHTSVINESKQLGQPKETTKQSIKNAKVNQVGKRFKVSKTYAQKFKNPGDNTISASEIPNVFGGDSDFSATLGFAHSTESGRGWNNMFWGNQWDFNLHTKSEADTVWNKVGLASLEVLPKHTIRILNFLTTKTYTKAGQQTQFSLMMGLITQHYLEKTMQ